MYFATYVQDGAQRYGVLDETLERILPLSVITEVDIPPTLLEFIRHSNGQVFDIIKQYLQKGADERDLVDIRDVKLCAPIPNPQRNVICLGLNYREHVAESTSVTGNQTAIPSAPVYFGKMASTIIGPEEVIDSHPDTTNELDYEVELAVVMGKDGKDIPIEEVEEYIFGYSVFNDITARDVQRRHGQWLRGKSLDTFTAMGPYLVHRSALPFPLKLELSCKVNGELRQKSNTEHLVFDIPTIISDLSKGLTLKAGDIIATGTPSGVGMGFDPPRYLKPGDVVECWIEGIGTLRNVVR